ncbi:MAG: GNAT family N-acetyltransferase [Gemmatimonas sp.]
MSASTSTRPERSPDTGVRFRRGLPPDAEAVSAFARRVFNETFGPLNDALDMSTYMEKAFTKAAQADELAGATRYCVIGERDGEIVSYALLRAGSTGTLVSGDSSTEIERFYVDAPWHGRGIADAMMDETMRIARAADAKTIWLGVWSQNARAIRFYEKRGFRDMGSQTFLLGTDLQVDRVMAQSLRESPRRESPLHIDSSHDG